MTEKKDAGKPGTDKQKAGSQPPATIDKTLADAVLNKVKVFTANKDLRLPPDYSPENALKSAWLILLETKDSQKRPVLEVCTKESIANSLLKMVLLGLNPLKSQCDFIAYGNKLSCDLNYFGNYALAKRLGDVKEVVPIIVYEGDTFEYEIKDGVKKVTKHIQSFENIDINKIKGAYATVYFNDPEHTPHIEIMTMAQIRQAWMQGAMKGNSPAHKNFPDQMGAKTVISRACKLFINASDDSELGIEAGDTKTIQSRQEIHDNANREDITMDTDAEIISDNGNGNGHQDKKQNDDHESSDQTVETDQSGNLSDLGKESEKRGF